MSDHLSSHERALLDALQRADTPDAGEQRRVKQRVFAELGLGAVGITAATVASQVSHAAPAAGAVALKGATTGAAAQAPALMGGGAAGSAVGTTGVGSTGLGTTAALGAGATSAAASGGFGSALLAKAGAAKLMLGLTAALATAGGSAAWWSQQQEVAAPALPSTATAPQPQPANPPPAALETPDEPLSEDVPRKTSVRRSAAQQLAPKSTLEEEAQLLAMAQQRISQGDAKSALDVLAEHQRRFPRGALSLERRATVAIAHCLSGQTSRGRGEAERFRRKHPNSPMVKRLESACKLESQ